ncbi:MAG: tetratricopeptide repeat protein [Bacteroidia bacterium]
MNRSLLVIAAFALLASCGNDDKTQEKIEMKKADQKEALHNSILRIEGEMHRTDQLNNVLAGQAVKAYDDYASMYPDDSLAPDYLFKAAEITTATKQYPQSAGYYEKIISDFPKYRLLQECYFMEATVYDQYLNQDDKARKIYEKFLSIYPDSHYAADVKAAISNLGKSDEELIKEFEKKNKGK